MCICAGDLFTSYSLTHAGLGVWNKETHLKLSLELVCYDYLGALLPDVVDNGGPYENLTTLEWNNTATIVLTKPMNESDWGEARLVRRTMRSHGVADCVVDGQLTSGYLTRDSWRCLTAQRSTI